MESRLDSSLLQTATTKLCAADPALAQIVATFGPPPLWLRPPGFATLIRIIIEQSISLPAAATIYKRLASAIGDVSAQSIADRGPAFLRTIGLSKSKANACLSVADSVITKQLQLDRLHTLDDDTVIASLCQLRGIGPWTANVYLLMALGRPDAWATGDLALEIAYQEVYGGEKRPSAKALQLIAERWRPYRAVAARILWTDYLARRNRLE